MNHIASPEEMIRFAVDHLARNHRLIAALSAASAVTVTVTLKDDDGKDHTFSQQWTFCSEPGAE